jgi:hypothetical protein
MPERLVTLRAPSPGEQEAERVKLTWLRFPPFPPWWVLLVACLVVCGWIVEYATRPARKLDEIAVQDANGVTHAFSLWQAAPLVPLPFIDTPHSYVRYGGRTYKLHGNDFGAAPGPIFVSPDRKQVAVCFRFEAAARAIYRIDLASGKSRNVYEFAHDLEQLGWQSFDWDWDRIYFGRRAAEGDRGAAVQPPVPAHPPRD